MPRLSKSIWICAFLVFSAALICTLEIGVTCTQATDAEAVPFSTPTPTATSGPIYAMDMEVIPARQEVRVGEILTVTAHIYNECQGCFCGIIDVELSQQGDDGPLLEFLSPPIIQPVGGTAAHYTLRAMTAGTVVLHAWAFGESNCGGGWAWIYVQALSDPISVHAPQCFLPLVWRNSRRQ